MWFRWNFISFTHENLHKIKTIRWNIHRLREQFPACNKLLVFSAEQMCRRSRSRSSGLICRVAEYKKPILILFMSCSLLCSCYFSLLCFFCFFWSSDLLVVSYRIWNIFLVVNFSCSGDTLNSMRPPNGEREKKTFFSFILCECWLCDASAFFVNKKNLRTFFHFFEDRRNEKLEKTIWNLICGAQKDFSHRNFEIFSPSSSQWCKRNWPRHALSTI